jgi:hypothetical protein
MTTHNSQTKADLLAMISNLEAKITDMEVQLSTVKKRGGKPEVVKVAKPYAGKQGHYFMLSPKDAGAACYHEISNRVAGLLLQEDFANKIRKSQLGRAMIANFEETGTVFFWSPNQNDLMFGPVSPGRNKARSEEIFIIPADQLLDLGKAFADDKAGKTAVESLVNLDGFIQMEKIQAEERKLQEKLNKLVASTK